MSHTEREWLQSGLIGDLNAQSWPFEMSYKLHHSNFKTDQDGSPKVIDENNYKTKDKYEDDIPFDLVNMVSSVEEFTKDYCIPNIGEVTDLEKRKIL